MKQMKVFKHFRGKNFGQRFSDMSGIVRIFRISQTAGKKNHLPVAEQLPVFGEQLDTADSSGVKAAAVNDHIVVGEIFRLENIFLIKGAGQRFRDPFCISPC